MRKPISGIKQGKHTVFFNGKKIKTMVYMDYKGCFIMVKGNRLSVKESQDKSGYIIK